MVESGIDLSIQFLKQGVGGDDSILKYHNAFENTGEAASSFKMADVRFYRATERRLG